MRFVPIAVLLLSVMAIGCNDLLGVQEQTYTPSDSGPDATIGGDDGGAGDGSQDATIADAGIDAGDVTQIPGDGGGNDAGPGGGDGASPLGAVCSADGECASAICVDGVCCKSACGGQCEACDVPDGGGICTAVSGAPHGSRPKCTGAPGAACTGTCAPGNTAGCTYPGGSTSCRAASCASGVETQAAGCNGSGSCPPAATVTCAPLACNAAGTGCANACNGDAQCSGTTPYCNGGSCLSTKEPGLTCTGGTECTSGFCVDGHCCNVACTEDCQACDVSGSVGYCTQVASGDQPHGTIRKACTGAGAGACGGSCQTASATACTYPTGPCSTPSCSGGLLTQGTSCASGVCPVGSQAACAGGYECASTTACATSCASDSDCIATDYCAANKQCTPQKTQAQPCNDVGGGDCAKTGCRECGSAGGCVNGYCCNATCGACQACNVAGSLGTCAAAPSQNGTTCGSGGVCSDGSCLTCTPPQVACNGACVNLGTTANCSKCGNTCTVGVACTNSQCLIDFGYTGAAGFNNGLDLVPLGTILFGFAISVSHPVTLTKLGLYVQQVTGTASVVMALYHPDSAGNLTLVAATPSTNLVVGTNEIAVTSSISLAVDTYWLFSEFSGQLKLEVGSTKIPTLSDSSGLVYGVAGLPNPFPFNTSTATPAAPREYYIVGVE